MTEVQPNDRKSGSKALLMTPWHGLASALLAGLVVWGALQVIMPVFQVSEELRALQGLAIVPRLTEFLEASREARIRNGMLSLVLLAATMALALTVTELIIRREVRRAVWGGLLAALIAGVVAIGAGAAGAGLSGAIRSPTDPTEKPPVPPLAKLMIVQSAALGVMGLGIGLAMSLPIPRPRPFVTCMAGCLLGGLLAALIFPPTVGFLLPDVGTEDLVPDSRIGRTYWLALVTGLIGLTVTGLGKEKKKTEPVSSSGSLPRVD